MLTDHEKHLCRTAPFLKGIGHGYGTPAEGYCPIGAVAVSRGAVFVVGPDGEYSAYIQEEDTLAWVPGPSFSIIDDAGVDVLAWVGISTKRAYLHALDQKGSEVFPPISNHQ